MTPGKISEMIVEATNLEINSIVVDGISGRKMPGITPTLLETISAWVFQFEALRNQLTMDRFKVELNHPMVKATGQWTKEKKTLFKKYVFTETDFNEFSKEALVTGVLDIDAMSSFREAMAEQMKNKPNADDHNAELFRLLKVQTRLMILKNQLEASFQDQKNAITKKHDFRHIQELRKLWELKDGFIYAQNIVQLDGDIIARSNLRIYRDRRIRDKTPQLLDFHRKNVDIGIKHWHFIIETIISIAKAVGEKLVNPIK